MKKVYEISCEMCSDLYPLVVDEIATLDSREAVLHHRKTCEHCAKQYEETTLHIVYEVDDRKVIRGMKKRLYLIGLCIVVLGALLGIGLTNTMGMFYNFMLMPIVGGIGYVVVRKKWYRIEGALFLIAYLWSFVRLAFEGVFSDGIAIGDFMAPMVYAVIYVILALLGVLIAKLLLFGLGKEG